eukprot:1963896-Amphidinium_carterae.1
MIDVGCLRMDCQRAKVLGPKLCSSVRLLNSSTQKRASSRGMRNSPMPRSFLDTHTHTHSCLRLLHKATEVKWRANQRSREGNLRIDTKDLRLCRPLTKMLT